MAQIKKVGKYFFHKSEIIYNNLFISNLKYQNRFNLIIELVHDCSINANEIKIERQNGDTFDKLNRKTPKALFFNPSANIVAYGSKDGFAEPFNPINSNNSVLINSATFISQVSLYHSAEL